MIEKLLTALAVVAMAIGGVFIFLVAIAIRALPYATAIVIAVLILKSCT